MDELKPCPVCQKGARETNFYLKGLDDPQERWFVRCLWCGYLGPESAMRNHKDAEKRAIELWNALPRTDYRALAKNLAEVLKGNDPCNGCDSLQYEERHCSSSPCKEKFMRDEALTDAKAAGVIE